MPVLEEADTSTARELAILLLEDLASEELMCSECGKNKAEWWNYHGPGRSCRSPYCGRCKRVAEAYFILCKITKHYLYCTICKKDKIKVEDVFWERMT